MLNYLPETRKFCELVYYFEPTYFYCNFAMVLLVYMHQISRFFQIFDRMYIKNYSIRAHEIKFEDVPGNISHPLLHRLNNKQSHLTEEQTTWKNNNKMAPLQDNILSFSVTYWLQTVQSSEPYFCQLQQAYKIKALCFGPPIEARQRNVTYRNIIC